MTLNFYLEIAGLMIGIILCCATSGKYKVVDLKGKIYVHMVRVATVLLGCNILAYSIVRKNVSFLMALAEVIVCLSFLMMVWIWINLNQYLIETIHGRNYLPHRTYITVGLPFFIELIVILINWGTHSVFDVVMVDDSIQIVFNTWYKVPYILAFLSLVIYLSNVIKSHKVLKDKHQYVFYVIPFLMVIIYYLQYQFKSIAILGFGYSIVFLLTYIYSYSRIVKIDSLTRLPDGMTFKKMLDYRIGQQQNMTVAMITLNDFKQVNREYGYNNGNRFLRMIAKYLKAQAPKQCIARYSGDKFAVIFDEQSYQQVENWCDDILERFERSWELGKLCHKLSVCITLVEYPVSVDSAEQILDLLEHMNTYGKRNKRNQYITCNDDFKANMQRRLHIAAMLNDVVQGGKIYIEYQPILEVAENSYTRAEALFCLKDEELGDVMPTEFFPIAEENGYIVDIGYIFFDKVCQYIKTFIDNNDKIPIISINLFRQQIMAEDVEEKVTTILKKYGVSPEYIAFELPESIFSVQYNAVKEQVLKLNRLGCRFYLDGFGNAFLDLTHLLELPFEMIKINKDMIKEAEHNDSIYLLVSAMTAVFEENGKLILGDGIETERLKEIADLLFMDFLQGRYLCEPLSAELAREEFHKVDVVEGVNVSGGLVDGFFDDEVVITEQNENV